MTTEKPKKLLISIDIQPVKSAKIRRSFSALLDCFIVSLFFFSNEAIEPWSNFLIIRNENRPMKKKYVPKPNAPVVVK